MRGVCESWRRFTGDDFVVRVWNQETTVDSERIRNRFSPTVVVGGLQLVNGPALGDVLPYEHLQIYTSYGLYHVSAQHLVDGGHGVDEIFVVHLHSIIHRKPEALMPYLVPLSVDEQHRHR